MPASGLTYFVDPASVERAIIQLAQLHNLTDQVRHGPASENVPHQVAQESETSKMTDTPRPSVADRDTETVEFPERHGALEPDVSGLVALLE